MALTITSSSYAGEHAKAYVNAALKQADTLKYLTIRENINYKEVINKIAGANLVKDRSCDFTENSATLTLTEQVLEVKPLQINIDLCKKTMLSDWSGRQEDDFVAYAMSFLGKSIADAVETSIWAGSGGTSGQFAGISATGMTASSASAAYTADNIIANLGTLVADVPASVYMSDDLYIYMNKKTYRFYIEAISALSAFPFNNMGEYNSNYNGIKIAVCAGVPDNVMYAGEASNLFFGTSLESDLTEVRMLDMADLDGSDNLRMVAKWTAGVQVGVPSDFTKQS
tara:strand:- start:49 stop:900 length:852 start_codon:yes stop_codon:yes gene_type:complete